MSSENSSPIPVTDTTILSSIKECFIYFRLHLGHILVIVMIVLLALMSYVTWRETKIASRYSSLGFILVDDDFARPPDCHDEFTVDELTSKLGEDRARLFAQLDRDGNGHISISEFEVLVHAVRDNPHELLQREQEKNAVLLSQPDSTENVENGVSLTVEVNDFHIYENNSLDESVDFLFREDLEWTGNLFPFGVHNYTVPSKIFAQAFLPFSNDLQSIEELVPGTLYPLIPFGPMFPHNLSPKTRFFPGPYFYPREKALHDIVKHFHPTRTFFFSRLFHVHPTAVVVASNEEYYHLAFKLFIEFQLSNTISPFWLIPDSLTGDIVIRKKSQEVVQFSMFQEQHMAVLNRVLPSGLVRVVSGFLTLSMNISALFPLDEIKWSKSIPLNEAFHHLNFASFPIRETPFMDVNSFCKHLMSLHENEIFNKRGYHIVITRTNLMDHSCQDICVDVREALRHPFVNPILRNEYNNVWINAHILAKEMQLMNASSVITNDKNTTLHVVMDALIQEIKNEELSVLTIHLNGSDTTPQIRPLRMLIPRLEHIKNDVRKFYVNPPSFWERFTQPPQEVRFRDTVADLYRRFLLNEEY